MVNISLTLRYDWAEYKGDVGTDGATPKSIMTQGPKAVGKVTEIRSELGGTAWGTTPVPQ